MIGWAAGLAIAPLCPLGPRAALAPPADGPGPKEAQAPSAGTRHVAGPDGVPARLSDVLSRVRDGDVVELMPGTYRGEVAVLPARRFTLRGVGRRPVLSATGALAEGRAILVVKGGDVRIENLELRGARARDAAGAGIRQEGGRLTLVDCAFYDNEHGVLTTNAEAAELDIQRCLFAQAPRIVGGLAHLLYAGRIAKLSIAGSRFHEGFEGHLIKSRARETRIAYNLIHDGEAGEASYEIDLPNAGRAFIVGNVIGQSRHAQNPVLVAYGSEGPGWDGSALYFAHNTLVNERWLPAWFLRSFRDRMPKGTALHAINNLVAGPGVFEWGAAGDFRGNAAVAGSALAGASTMSFEIAPGRDLAGETVDPRNVGGWDLSPKAEFAMPLGTRTLAARTRWSPGAFQR